MLLTVRTLPQLAVSAKLLCLLMVVICGAVPSMVRSVRLYNDCSSSEVRVDMEGRVFADDDQTDKSHKLKNLTIRSLDFSVKLTIFAVEAQRYLCFNKKWKLVGSKKFKGEMCEFYEDMEKNGYNRYRSVANESHFVGFNRRGKPLRGGQSRQRSKCLNFLKFDTEFSINSHNQRIAGGNFTAEVPAHAHQQLLKNKQQKTSFVNSNNNSTTALISHKRGNKNKQQNRKNSVRQRFRHEKHHRNGKKTS